MREKRFESCISLLKTLRNNNQLNYKTLGVQLIFKVKLTNENKLYQTNIKLGIWFSDLGNK